MYNGTEGGTCHLLTRTSTLGQTVLVNSERMRLFVKSTVLHVIKKQIKNKLSCSCSNVQFDFLLHCNHK